MNITENFIIGITTYNRYDYLDQLIDDIERQTVWPKEIYISDNGDGYKLKKQINIPINIIKNSYNFGTCRGTNQILKLNKNNIILLMCDDNYFIDKNSLQNITNKFRDEKIKNLNHLIWVNHWACFIASSEWFNSVGYLDEHIWPCYNEDSDLVERIRKLSSTNITHNCTSYPSLRCINNCEETEVVGNRRGTGEILIAPKYSDFKNRNYYYHNYKWKNKLVDTGNLHENTHTYCVDQSEIDIKDFEIQYLKNKIKDLSFTNEYNWLNEFVDDILELKEFKFDSIIEYKTQRTYMSRLLLMLEPKRLISYDDEFDLCHDYCYHFNYLLKNKTNLQLLNSKQIENNECDLLVINYQCDLNILNKIKSKFLIVFNDKDVNIDGFKINKNIKGTRTNMFLYIKE